MSRSQLLGAMQLRNTSALLARRMCFSPSPAVALETCARTLQHWLLRLVLAVSSSGSRDLYSHAQVKISNDHTMTQSLTNTISGVSAER